MPRPIVLIKRQKLEELYNHYSNGVPVSQLLRRHNLQLSPPTLAKLLKCMEAYNANKSFYNSEKFTHIGKIKASLFPDWLDNANTDIATSPPGWSYVGMFPLGEWKTVEFTKQVPSTIN